MPTLPGVGCVHPGMPWRVELGWCTRWCVACRWPLHRTLLPPPAALRLWAMAFKACRLMNQLGGQKGKKGGGGVSCLGASSHLPDELICTLPPLLSRVVLPRSFHRCAVHQRCGLGSQFGQGASRRGNAQLRRGGAPQVGYLQASTVAEASASGAQLAPSSLSFP